MRTLSEELRNLCIKAVSREGLTKKILKNERACEHHFVFGQAVKLWDRSNVYWVPTDSLGQSKEISEA